MANIEKIALHIETIHKRAVGTDGDVYLGICGREFYVDSDSDQINDFQYGDSRDNGFGAGANVKFKTFNDPRSPRLDQENIYRFPAYVRFGK
jgi:hypothetical protein